ncbi:hypothetical protein VTO73DRAFT_10921 [Trametes versicolor]
MADLYQAEVIAAYSTATIAAACNIAAVTLVFYDYALTFDQEVRNIWRIRFSSSALLFYVARYAALFTSIWIVLNGTVWSGQNNLFLPLNLLVRLTLVARACTVASDLLVLGLTLLNTWPLRAHGPTLGVKTTFSQTLMRNGTLSFVVISVVNIIGLGLGKDEQLIEPMSTWTAAFTAIMTYRFLLNLHEVARVTAGNVTTQGGHSVTFHAGQHDTLVFRASRGHQNGVSRIADEINGVYGGASGANGEIEDEWDGQVTRSSWEAQTVETC